MGPALAGLLIGQSGGANVLAVDALSYYVLVACLAALSHATGRESPGAADQIGLGPAFRFIRSTPAVWMITLMFMSANIAGGMISVLLPVYAREYLKGDAQTYGLLVSAGSLAVGAVAWPWTLGRSIAVAQLLSSLAYTGLLAAPGLWPAVVILARADLLSSPLTI